MSAMPQRDSLLVEVVVMVEVRWWSPCWLLLLVPPCLSPSPRTIATTLSSCSTTAYTISWITLPPSVANLGSRAALGSSSTRGPLARTFHLLQKTHLATLTIGKSNVHKAVR